MIAGNRGRHYDENGNLLSLSRNTTRTSSTRRTSSSSSRTSSSTRKKSSYLDTAGKALQLHNKQLYLAQKRADKEVLKRATYQAAKEVSSVYIICILYICKMYIWHVYFICFCVSQMCMSVLYILVYVSFVSIMIYTFLLISSPIYAYLIRVYIRIYRRSAVTVYPSRPGRYGSCLETTSGWRKRWVYCPTHIALYIFTLYTIYIHMLN